MHRKFAFVIFCYELVRHCKFILRNLEANIFHRMEKNERSELVPNVPPEVKVVSKNKPIITRSEKSNIVVITGGPTVVSNFGPEAQVVTCPYCHYFVTTQVYSGASTKTHLFALVLCMCCCWLCSCCPYLIDSCQDRNHYCPQCKAFLGSYRS